MRKVVFANEEYYHIYNRGVDKREVFLDDADYVRFLKDLRDFNDDLIREERLRRQNVAKSELNSESELSSDKRLVEIIAYCLNPNHYHLILKQVSKKGIEKFMHKISTGYTNYFNKKYERSGALFQGRFKSVHIDSDEYLLYLSAYVNRNNFIHGYSSAKDEWQYCSILDYLGKRKGTLCKKGIIINQFNDGEYKNFLDKNSEHLKEKKDLARYYLE